MAEIIHNLFSVLHLILLVSAMIAFFWLLHKAISFTNVEEKIFLSIDVEETIKSGFDDFKEDYLVLLAKLEEQEKQIKQLKNLIKSQSNENEQI